MSHDRSSEPHTSTQSQLAAIKSVMGEGAFTAVQARAAGVTPDQIHRLVRLGLITSVLFGVYRIGKHPPDLIDRAKAAGLALPPDGAIARRTAAWLFGVDPRSPDERDQPMDVECVVPRSITPPRRMGLQCFGSDVEAADLTEIDGTVVTTPTRTAADLLRWLSPPMGLATVDAMAAEGLIHPRDVIEMLERWPGHRFVAQARRLAWAVEPLTESFGESWLRLRILDAGFPRPTVQIPIHDSTGRVIYRLDLGWPEYKIAIEYDGQEFHSSPSQLKADLRRRERLGKDFGWHVVGVGLGEVLGRDMQLELGIGELLGLEPTIRRRAW